jgi:hypothetical protein
MQHLYVVRANPVMREILTEENGKYGLHTEYDLRHLHRENELRKREIGRGFIHTRKGELFGKEEFEAPYDVLMNDPDGKEWFHTRNPAAKKRFLAKYPGFRTSEGGI